jgi:hypothetical protein
MNSLIIHHNPQLSTYPPPKASSNFQTTYKVSNKNNITQQNSQNKGGNVVMSVSHDCAIAKTNAPTRSFSEKSF